MSAMSLKHSVARDAKAISSGGTPVMSGLQPLALITLVSPAYMQNPPLLELILVLEICYRIQYPVRNNRNRGDPFSMRQTGVCHQSSGRQSSAWIVLQPSPEVANDIQLAMSDVGYNRAVEEDPMLLHAIFLSYQSANWDDYLEYLRADLETLVRRFLKDLAFSVNANSDLRMKPRISPELARAVLRSILIRTSL